MVAKDTQNKAVPEEFRCRNPGERWHAAILKREPLMKPSRLLLYSIVLLLTCTAFSNSGCSVPSDPLETVVPVSSDDAEMNAAKTMARKTIGEYIDARKEQGGDFRGLVKVYFEDKNTDHGEHMWVLVTSIKDTNFEGILTSPPSRLANFSKGDDVEFTTDDISDWMLPRDGKAVGAYTVRVIRARLSPEQRRQHDHGFPFSFD